jgi:hypothetical protein
MLKGKGTTEIAGTGAGKTKMRICNQRQWERVFFAAFCCFQKIAKKKGEIDMEKIKERINKLIEAIKEDPDMLALIQEMVDSCANYVDTVVNMENAITIARFKIDDPSEYRAHVQRLDQSRRIAHNVLISNVRIVDRLCKVNKVEPVYGGHDEDRLAIAEFAKQVVDEFFEERKK